ncbi:hypothetical protein [Rikenella microfusus]|nr:hypothetical protein [Rikenella microfusus]
MRTVGLRYSLSRVGMIRDTIHTAEPDTLYARGVTLLQQRRYTEAERILSGYKDRNTAVALLSLGRNRQAYDILCTLPRSAVTEYLTAIALARLERRTEAISAFERAAALDERMRYRAGLDPELNDLLKNR